ncbi:TetR/AcrR family transcriptional regulator [Tabrizicola sp.]|uniref:TetR/AcrR family transcriptional regulator n=1 Tax=Tabrizicola sp. TaxID=2005166 RepID=UPI003F3EB6ED
MARPRAYDPDDAVTAAMRVFWQKGYVATSMSDIYAATGLKPGNLYATFTDKESLFRRAFEAYGAQFRATLPQDRRGLRAIGDWLDVQARLASEDPDRKGCLIVNTLAEREALSPETQALADTRLAEIKDFFAGALREARSDGELEAHVDLAATADFLTGSVLAIMALGRARAPEEMIWNMAATAKEALKGPGSSRPKKGPV